MFELRAECPHCSRPIEVHQGDTPDAQPSEGAVSLCWGCLKPSLYMEDLSLRLPTEEEVMRILADKDVQAAIINMALYRTPSAAVKAWREQRQEA